MTSSLAHAPLRSLLGVSMVATIVLLVGMSGTLSPAASGMLEVDPTGPVRGGPTIRPPDLVLRLPDGRAVPGALGTYAWGDDEEFVIADSLPVVPAEPLEVAVGSPVRVDAGALGTPNTVSYELYRLRRGALEPGTSTVRGVGTDACELDRGEWPSAEVVPVVLDLSPGRYALMVSAYFDGGRDAHYGFSLRVTHPDAGTPRAPAAGTAAAATPTDGARSNVLRATAASPCATRPA